MAKKENNGGWKEKRKMLSAVEQGDECHAKQKNEVTK